LKKKKICARWVSHALSDEEKQKRLDAATLLKRWFVAEGMDFLQQIIAINETWLRDFESELKSQSKNGGVHNLRDPKNFDAHNQKSSK